ncbi:MAG: hypothetical protein ISR51_03275 [Rhodospirillales bacterium]|nr:hypothetical protein [Alphaproteobacteria bacterium]MBL6947675.1 hypothetical protein [Rhodospirillales bacterium]
MDKNSGYLSSISDGFSTTGGDELSLIIILAVVAAGLVWSVYYHTNRRDVSPFDPL